MRNVSDAAKISKVVGKVLALLEKESLTEEQVVSVMKATEETLGIKTCTETACLVKKEDEVE